LGLLKGTEWLNRNQHANGTLLIGLRDLRPICGAALVSAHPHLCGCGQGCATPHRIRQPICAAQKRQRRGKFTIRWRVACCG